MKNFYNIKKQKIKFSKSLIIWVFFLFIGIVVPSIVAIKNESQKEEASKLYNWQLSKELSKGTVFEQKVYIPGYITRYGVLFTTYGRTNKGKIKIELSQGSKKKVEIIDDNYIYYLGNKEDIAKFIETLVNKKIKIYSVVKCKESLEDIFIKKTGGK